MCIYYVRKRASSARSYWKRGAVRAGRRSRYVEVREVSLEPVRADAVECCLVDEVVAVLGTGRKQMSTSVYGSSFLLP